MTNASRVVLSLLLLGSAVPAAAQGTRGQYFRTEMGQAVTVPWAEARVGRVLGSGRFAMDVGLGGSEGVFSLSSGLEARTRPSGRLAFFGRLDLGGVAASGGRFYAMVNLGGGIDVRLNPAWSVRLGVSKGLPLGDGVTGPDRVYAGLEYRW